MSGRNRHLRGGLALVVACAVAACARGRERYDTPEAAVAEIDTASVRTHVAALADDSMRGRATPSPELWKAARYVAEELRASGLHPFFPDSFAVSYALEERRLDTARVSVGLRGEDGWGFRRGVLPRGGATTAQGITGPVVLVVGEPAKGSVDLEEADVEGRVVLLVLPERNGIGSAFWTIVARIPTPAALLLYSEATDSMWESRGRAVTAAAFHPPEETGISVPVFELGREAVSALLSRSGRDLASVLGRANGPLAITPLTGVEVEVRLPYRTTDSPGAPIVVAEWGASGAEREVVLSAHLDHLGTTSGGDVYNGADDNASGVSALLEVARAFGLLDAPTGSRVVFLFTSGEEKGGWGVDAFLRRLEGADDDVVADLNLDMVGRNAADTIHLIEPADGTLLALAKRIAVAHPELGLDIAGDAWPAADFLSRSDQAAFLRKNVPAAYLFAGPHADYHQTTDDPETLDYGKVARVARLAFYMAASLAGVGGG